MTNSAQKFLTDSDNNTVRSEADRDPDSKATSDTLLSQLRAESQEAWNEMVMLYGPLVYSWCRRVGLQPANANDVVQEVFRVVFQKIGEFRKKPHVGAFRGWLSKITRHKLGDLFRKQKNDPRAIGGSDVREKWEQIPFREGTEHEFEDDGDHAAIYQQAMEIVRSEFEQKSWEAFRLVVCEEQTPRDVAEKLGLSVNAVYLAKSRILSRLRSVLGEELNA